MKILFLAYQWSVNTHVSCYSGYQYLVRCAAKENNCTVVTWGKENRVSNENGINVHYVKPFINKDFFFSKRFAISRYAARIDKGFDVVHALHSECGYFQKHQNFFATLHVSYYIYKGKSFFEKVFLFLKLNLIEKKVFKGCKKIFILSNNLTQGLEKFNSKMKFIPHGINTEYWKPEHIESKEKYLLSVGNHGVDKEFLKTIILDNPEVKFIIVGLRNFNCNLGNVQQFHNISNEQLKKLYCGCSVFIKPMKFAAANNSILEALSVGKPIIISTPDGKYDYFIENLPFVKIAFKDDFSITIKRFLELVNKEDFVVQSKFIRDYAIRNFDWSVIWKATHECYIQ